jgi:hypothetical protein
MRWIRGLDSEHARRDLLPSTHMFEIVCQHDCPQVAFLGRFEGDRQRVRPKL